MAHVRFFYSRRENGVKNSVQVIKFLSGVPGSSHLGIKIVVKNFKMNLICDERKAEEESGIIFHMLNL